MVPRKNFIVNLIQNHSIYEKKHFSRTHNSMAQDFGFPPSTTKSMSIFISSYMMQITFQFKLVLVLEKLDESLVLLKRYLDWELFDILYIPDNRHEHEKVSLKAEDIAKFKSVSFLDYIIYDEFVKILKWKMKLEGATFQEEVDHFKTVLRSVREFCSGESDLEFLHVHSSRWTCPFILTASDCKLMTMVSREITIPILIERHKKMHKLKKV